MGNIRNFNFNKLDLRLSNSDYWDFYLSTDGSSLEPNTPPSSGDCFVVWYDFNNSATTASTIYSLVSWTGSTNTGYTLNTLGLTGLDNGLVSFQKDPLDPTNQALLSALTGTTLVIPSGDTRLTLNQVTGTTEEYTYPITYLSDSSGYYKQFCGGFYQGFYKIDGTNYEVLPNRVNQGWVAEFWLKPNSGCTEYKNFQSDETFEFMDDYPYQFMDQSSEFTGRTLNNTYPNNKGIFFYIGTRAENKFWNQFEGADTGCTSACTISDSGCTGTVSTFCTVLKEPDITLIGDNGFGIPLNPPRVETELVTNQFLIYGRANDKRADKLTGETGTIIASAITNTSDKNACCDLNSYDGLGTQNVCEYDGNGIWVGKSVEIQTDFRNPFLIYGRGNGYLSGCSCSQCCGSGDGLGNQTVCIYSGKTSKESEIDYNLDIIDNALGFRIKDDGSIGYRLLTVSGQCYTTESGERLYTSGITIQEEYSASGMVPTDVWSYIAIRFVTDFKEGCDLELSKPRSGKLMFYVNAKLKFVVDEFPEFIAKRLDENKLKQVGVPFNISLGGGTQGLIESQTFDGLDEADRNLPLETHFGGTFIGGISQFKFNICDLSFNQIKNNYNNDLLRYRT
jgi:hypothetical protein